MDNIYKPRKIEDHTYKMCGKTFQLYSLENIDFKSPLYIGEGKGVYSFTHREAKVSIVCKNGKNVMLSTHSLIYLGKSDNLKERLYKHDRLNDIKNYDTDVIGVYFCSENEEPKEIESLILRNYFFKLNTAENTDHRDKKVMVMEE